MAYFEVKYPAWRNVSAVYRIDSVEASKPLISRLNLLLDLSANLKNFKLSEGKKNAVEKHSEEFNTLINKCLGHNEAPYYKLHNISNQGYRSIVKFYESFHYYPETYSRYFTHNILFLYILGKRELYSQLHLSGCKLPKISYFPNMFLVRCDNYYNNQYSEVFKEHKVIYWLKYLILHVCYIKGKVSIGELLKIFNEYEDHVVRLSIGSLATVNEYNCLKMDFEIDINGSRNDEYLNSSMRRFEERTFVSPTKRGEYLVKDEYALGFECLQLYIDDWLLPLPRKDSLKVSKDITEGVYNPVDKDNNSYHYLLDATDYDSKRKDMIDRKAKQSLLLLSFLQASFKCEQERYSNSWEKVEKLVGKKTTLFNNDAFVNLRDRLKTDAYKAIGKDDKFKLNIDTYDNTIELEMNKIIEFYRNGVNITIHPT